MRIRWLLFAIAPIEIVGCAGTARRADVPGGVIVTTSPSPTAKASTQTTHFTTLTTTELPCPESALAFDDGQERGIVCAAEVRAPRVVVDLRDAWTPRLFAPTADGLVPEFRATYLALATERDAAGKPLPPNEALAELYGVVPSLAIVRDRLADEARHACHAQIDVAPIAQLDRPYGQDHGAQVRAMAWTRQHLAAQLEKERVRRKLPDVAALSALADTKLDAMIARLAHLQAQHAGLVAVQQKLVCEGLLDAKEATGVLTWKTGVAIGCSSAATSCCRTIGSIARPARRSRPIAASSTSGSRSACCASVSPMPRT